MRASGLLCIVLAVLFVVVGLILSGPARPQEEQRPSRATPLPDHVSSGADSRAVATKETPRGSDSSAAIPASQGVTMGDLAANLTIFVLAIFVGFEVITKVPPTLHTPLMSGSNAISGITIVGALVIAATGLWGGEPLVGFVAVILATINVVGGFLVTHRMLRMFQRNNTRR